MFLEYLSTFITPCVNQRDKLIDFTECFKHARFHFMTKIYSVWEKILEIVNEWALFLEKWVEILVTASRQVEKLETVSHRFIHDAMWNLLIVGKHVFNHLDLIYLVNGRNALGKYWFCRLNFICFLRNFFKVQSHRVRLGHIRTHQRYLCYNLRIILKYSSLPIRKEKSVGKNTNHS